MAWRRRANQLDSLLVQRLRRTLLQNSLHNWMYATFDGLLVANAKFQDDLIQAQVHLFIQSLILVSIILNQIKIFYF